MVFTPNCGNCSSIGDLQTMFKSLISVEFPFIHERFSWCTFLGHIISLIRFHQIGIRCLIPLQVRVAVLSKVLLEKTK